MACRIRARLTALDLTLIVHLAPFPTSHHDDPNPPRVMDVCYFLDPPLQMTQDLLSNHDCAMTLRLPHGLY